VTSGTPSAPRWALLSTAAIALSGIATIFIGIAIANAGPMLLGATLFGGGCVAFLVVHSFMRTPELDEPEPSIPFEVAVPAPAAQNFDHLLSHTLERTRHPREGDASEWRVVPAGVAYLQMREEGNPLPEPALMHRVRSRVATLPREEQPIVAGRPVWGVPEPSMPPRPVGAGPAARRAKNLAASMTQPRVIHRPLPVVPASKRRGEWNHHTPTVDSVIGTPSSVTDHRRPGRTRGQCGGCGTALWAPAYRPIRIRCPSCQKSAWLQS
jgi:hypothetical protein